MESLEEVFKLVLLFWLLLEFILAFNDSEKIINHKENDEQAINDYKAAVQAISKSFEELSHIITVVLERLDIHKASQAIVKEAFNE